MRSPEEVIIRAVKSFLTRLRYVTRGAQIPAFDWSRSSWRIRYLNDDGSELAEDAKLRRGLGAARFTWSWVGLNEQIWENAYSLPPDYAPPVWNNLLLDAEAALPNVGTAVVLAATCLEVFISQILNELARKSQLSPDLWAWLNNRGDWLREPTTEEQFDALLKHFTTHSLKEDLSLWESFKNLKTARNSFVHEGSAKVGGKLVSPSDAAKMVNRVRAIIKWVKEFLPDDLKWPEFEPSVAFTIEQAFPQRPKTPQPIGGKDTSE